MTVETSEQSLRSGVMRPRGLRRVAYVRVAVTTRRGFPRLALGDFLVSASIWTGHIELMCRLAFRRGVRQISHYNIVKSYISAHAKDGQRLPLRETDRILS